MDCSFSAKFYATLRGGFLLFVTNFVSRFRNVFRQDFRMLKKVRGICTEQRTGPNLYRDAWSCADGRAFDYLGNSISVLGT